MPIRKIAHIGHPVLRQKARPLGRDELLRAETQQLIDDLILTMRDADGAGLAAPQVYEPLAICVLEVEKNPRYPYLPALPLSVLVNPELELLSDETFGHYEGCLSVPNLRGEVARHLAVRVRAWDRHGATLDFAVRGLAACVYQHEVDHLNATLFIDRLTSPRTLCTLQEYERHHRAPFLERAQAMAARYGTAPGKEADAPCP